MQFLNWMDASIVRDFSKMHSSSYMEPRSPGVMARIFELYGNQVSRREGSLEAPLGYAGLVPV